MREKLRFVIEVEPIMPVDPNDDWYYKYYGGIIEQALSHRFLCVKIFSAKGLKRGK